MDKLIAKLLAACKTYEERCVILEVSNRIGRATTFPRWLEDTLKNGNPGMPHDDPVFVMAEKMGVTDRMVRLCWQEFKDRHLDDPKRNIDWRKVFRNCVRGNWYRLWYTDNDGKVQLTSQGRALEKLHE